MTIKKSPEHAERNARENNERPRSEPEPTPAERYVQSLLGMTRAYGLKPARETRRLVDEATAATGSLTAALYEIRRDGAKR